MLKAAELEIKVRAAGKITIPPEVIKELGIGEGDEIRLIYLHDQAEPVEQVKEFFLVDGKTDVEAMLQNKADLQITRRLLETAGMSADVDLQVQCLDGEIVIRPLFVGRDDAQGKKEITPEQILPAALLKLLTDTGIPQENIQMVFHMPADLRKENQDGKVNLSAD